jgi:D-cysteine desulfhydrase
VIIQRLPGLSRELGVNLSALRDDLLPFPLSGNKFRKVVAEAAAAEWKPGDLVITNGGVTSNHCRTVAMYSAQNGVRAHLVLHGDPGSAGDTLSLQLLRDLGATWSVVKADEISTEIERVRDLHARSTRVHLVSGGGHTVTGARALRDAAMGAAREVDVDHVYVASGTGATQAGIIAGMALGGSSARVTGISVARTKSRGTPAVEEALDWLDCPAEVFFDDNHIDGGYGLVGESTRAAVALGWVHGLPLDGTYTGKAFNGLLTAVDSGAVAQGSRVLFWHTGGLMNHLEGMVHRA